MENLQELLAISQIAANAHSVIAKFDSQSDLCLRLESLSKNVAEELLSITEQNTRCLDPEVVKWSSAKPLVAKV